MHLSDRRGFIINKLVVICIHNLLHCIEMHNVFEAVDLPKNERDLTNVVGRQCFSHT